MTVPEGSRKLIAYAVTVVAVAIMSATGGLDGETAASVIQWAFIALVGGNVGEHAARALTGRSGGTSVTNNTPPRDTAEMRERFGVEVVAPVELQPADRESIGGTRAIRDRVRGEDDSE